MTAMDLGAVRIRLTAWYTLVVAVALIATGAISHGIVRQQIRRATARGQRMMVRQLEAALTRETSETRGVLTVDSAHEVLAELSDSERPISILTSGRRLFASSRFPVKPNMRVLASPMRVGNGTYIAVVGQSLQAQDELLESLRNGMLLTIPLALLIAAGGGYLLARKNLTPVAEAFESQRRFMADASHELRTPVAILQGELDVTLSRGDRSADEYRASMEVMRKTARRLTRIVRDLFLLARGDAKQYPLNDGRFYLDEVIAQTVRTFRTVASERGIALSEEHESGLMMSGDEDLIERMAGNLIDNAIRHARGRVLVRCGVSRGEYRIEVSDDGPGIAPELRERIFERFFRGEPSRSGLGLPIARWIAEAHGGRVWLEQSDQSGSAFSVSLPAASPPPPSRRSPAARQ
jgi:signal transduction histidine kinase